MAVINLAITVPDAQIGRVQAAARATFGQVSDGAGGFRDMTNAEIVERIRQETIHMIKRMVFAHEKRLDEIAVSNNTYDVEAT